MNKVLKSPWDLLLWVSECHLMTKFPCSCLKEQFWREKSHWKCIRTRNVSRSAVWKNCQVNPSLIIMCAQLPIQYGAGNCKIRSIVKFDFIFENLTWKLNTSFFNCIIAFSGKSMLGYCISDFFCTAVHKPFCSQDLNINNYLCHSYLKALVEN